MAIGEPRVGTARDTLFAVFGATLVNIPGLFLVLEAFRQANEDVEDIGSAPELFLGGSAVLALAIFFNAWKSRRNDWVKWSLLATFMTFAGIMLLGPGGPIISLPIAAAVTLRIDDRRFVKARIIGVVFFLVAFVASFPLGILPVFIVALLPYVTPALADRFLRRRYASEKG